MAAQELDDIGEVVIEEADIVGDWQRPGYDVAASTVGVFDGDRLVGVRRGRPTATAATPRCTPTTAAAGIGTALARWMQDKAREKGSTVIGMPVPEGSPGDRLLEALGYQRALEQLGAPAARGRRRSPERALPEGYAVRAAEPRPSTSRAGPSRRTPSSSGRSASARPSRTGGPRSSAAPGFEPWNLRVVTDPAGEVVGVAVAADDRGCGFIARLATRRDQRGRGLAQALLVDAFARARAHGADALRALHRLPHRRARPLREGRHGRVTSNWVNRAIERLTGLVDRARPPSVTDGRRGVEEKPKPHGGSTGARRPERQPRRTSRPAR